jgi:hypothetical protein
MNNQNTQHQPWGIALAALFGGIVAAVVNVGWFLATHASGVDFVMQPDPSKPAAMITIPSVAIASVIPAFIAGGLLWVLRRFTKQPARTFLVISIAFALLSLAGPATVGGANAGTRMALMAMHLIAAAVISGALLRQGRAADGTTADSR